MTYKEETNYVLSYQSTEELDNGVLEFETYTEAFEAYQQYQMSGYDVVIHDLERTKAF
jgi:hypothetical protein